MLWTVAMVLLVLWMLGMGTSYTGGGVRCAVAGSRRT
jgi:uncharacterized protein DUF5670